MRKFSKQNLSPELSPPDAQSREIDLEPRGMPTPGPEDGWFSGSNGDVGIGGFTSIQQLFGGALNGRGDDCILGG